MQVAVAGVRKLLYEYIIENGENSMKFNYAPNNKNYFATNLKTANGKLRWDINMGGTTLIIQGRFGEDILPAMEEICEELGKLDRRPDENFVSLAPGFPFLSAMILDPRQKARQGGCIIKDEVCRYTVFACRVNGEECTVFEPKRAYTVDMPAEISVTYAKVYDHIKTRFSRKVKEEFAGFYEVSFENSRISSYKNGDIYYAVNDINIPVTDDMIQADCFYIKTEIMPELMSKNEGFHITMREIQ